MSSSEPINTTSAPFNPHGESGIRCAAFRPGGESFAVIGESGRVKFYKADTGAFVRELAVFEKQAQLLDLAFSGDRKRIVVLGNRSNLVEARVWVVDFPNDALASDPRGQTAAERTHADCDARFAIHEPFRVKRSNDC